MKKDEANFSKSVSTRPVRNGQAIRQNRDKATPRTTLSFRRRFLTSRSLPISAVCPPYRENIFCSIPRLFSSVFAKFGRGLIVSFVERFGETIGICIPYVCGNI